MTRRQRPDATRAAEREFHDRIRSSGYVMFDARAVPNQPVRQREASASIVRKARDSALGMLDALSAPTEHPERRMLFAAVFGVLGAVLTVSALMIASGIVSLYSVVRGI